RRLGQWLCQLAWHLTRPFCSRALSYYCGPKQRPCNNFTTCVLEHGRAGDDVKTDVTRLRLVGLVETDFPRCGSAGAGPEREGGRSANARKRVSPPRSSKRGRRQAT